MNEAIQFRLFTAGLFTQRNQVAMTRGMVGSKANLQLSSSIRVGVLEAGSRSRMAVRRDLAEGILEVAAEGILEVAAAVVAVAALPVAGLVRVAVSAAAALRQFQFQSRLALQSHSSPRSLCSCW